MTVKVSKYLIIVIIACILSFLMGFFFNPLYETTKKVNYSAITDSVYVSPKIIDVYKLNTPKDGYHTWLSPKGNLYMGVWKQGVIKKGVIITDKSIYEGEIQNLSPHGYGIMYYNNGDVFRGNWIAGNKEGIGLMKKRNNNMFFGHWRAGLLNVSNGSKYRVEEKVYGIDLSYYQGTQKINWKELALYSDSKGEVYAQRTMHQEYMQPVLFTFIRSTRGLVKDSNYVKHITNAREHNLIVGSYHFFTIDDDVETQIETFISHTKWEKGDLPPILDLETNPQKIRQYGVEKMQKSALKWLKAIEKNYNVKPIIYTSENWKKCFLLDKRFDRYNYWLARYNNVYPTDNDWIFWQRTDRAVPNGYKSNIDVDIFKGSYKDFIEYRNSL